MCDVLAVQRKLSIGPERIDAVRSVRGQVKGALTKDTLSKLRKVVADHQAAADEGADDRLAVILGLCDHYISRHGDETDKRTRAKVAAVEDIKAAALAERGRRQAEAQYLKDAYAKKSAAPTSQQYSPTRFGEQSANALQYAHPAAAKLAKGEAYAGALGATKDTVRLVKTYGLTEAEILAVKTYTAPDYKYINPATAFSQSWMKAQNLKGKPDDYLETDEGAAHMKRLMEEGSLHGALAISGLTKLPPQQGTCYRGERMTEAQFTERYGTPDNRKYPSMKRLNLTSIATVREAAEKFANNQDGTAGPDQTVRVMWEVAIKTGRDARQLSVFGAHEGEWLLLPGTELKTVHVEELTTGTGGGSPTPTKWVTIKATEV